MPKDNGRAKAEGDKPMRKNRDPDPEEIKRECEQIRRSWDELTYLCRSHHLTRPEAAALASRWSQDDHVEPPRPDLGESDDWAPQ